MPPKSWNETVEFLADIDGLPILMRFQLEHLTADIRSELVREDTDIHSLLSNTFEKMLERMRGSPLQRDDLQKRSLAAVESIPNAERADRPPLEPNETVLRVGPLELDLIDRTAKRAGRSIDLRPREFRLLKYMMERSDQLLARATLLKEVWHYNFIPETNLVDVHMGRVRRKVDGPHDAPMIRNVRGVGFVLSATPALQASTTNPAERSTARPPESDPRDRRKGRSRLLTSA
jgi:DNA-binding response OmpR family regulator